MNLAGPFTGRAVPLISHPSSLIPRSLIPHLLSRAFWALSAVFALAAGSEAAEYLGPTAVAATPDGSRLLVACSDGKQIALVDPSGPKVLKMLAVPAKPTGIAISRDGRTAYVTCAAARSTVCVLDVAGMNIVRTFPAGHTAVGPAISPDGQRLYVCNRFDGNVSVIDVSSGKELAKVPAVREPLAAAVTPDGKSVFVINHLPLDRADGYRVAAEVTVIDTASNCTASVRLPNGSTALRGLCISPDGKQVYVTHILARYQLPTTQLERGWMNTNALSILNAGTKTLLNTVLLDDVDLGAANPWGVGLSADGRTLCVAHAGTHEISLIDAAGLLKKLAQRHTKDVPNDLAFLVDLRKRIALGGNGPRGLAVVGNRAYAAEYFSDSLAVVDLVSPSDQPFASSKPAEIALGGRPALSVRRRGEMLFNDATVCFQHWQSCATCHPDARMDALNWDLMNDGLGNPKNTKSLLLAMQTPPSMWTGVRATPESAVRSGITHILFAVRPEADAQAIDEYLRSLEAAPSPHLDGGRLSESARRGKALFESDEVGCAVCHPAPLYTDLAAHDVGSEDPYDHRSTFFTPSLVECWRTAPYLHDGHWLSIKALLTGGKHGQKGGGAARQSSAGSNSTI